MNSLATSTDSLATKSCCRPGPHADAGPACRAVGCHAVHDCKSLRVRRSVCQWRCMGGCRRRHSSKWLRRLGTCFHAAALLPAQRVQRLQAPMQLLCERLMVVGQREERVAVRTGRCHVHVGEREPLPEAPLSSAGTVQGHGLLGPSAPVRQQGYCAGRRRQPLVAVSAVPSPLPAPRAELPVNQCALSGPWPTAFFGNCNFCYGEGSRQPYTSEKTSVCPHVPHASACRTSRSCYACSAHIPAHMHCAVNS